MGAGEGLGDGGGWGGVGRWSLLYRKAVIP